MEAHGFGGEVCRPKKQVRGRGRGVTAGASVAAGMSVLN